MKNYMSYLFTAFTLLLLFAFNVPEITAQNSRITGPLCPCSYYNNYNSTGASSCSPYAITQVNSHVYVSAGLVQFEGAGDLDRVYTQHGLTLGGAWRLDFNFNYSSFDVISSNVSMNLISLTANSSPTSSNKGVCAMLEDMTPNQIDNPFFEIAGQDQLGSHSMTGWQPSPNTDYFVSIYYVNKKVFYVAYSDAARTNKIALYTGPSTFAATSPNAQVFPYIQHGGKLAHQGGGLWATLDNSCLSNITPGPGTISGNTTITCGSTTPITLNSVSPGNIGGNVPFVYQWEYLSGTTWIAINGASSSNLTLTNPPQVTTKYRRRVFIIADYPEASSSFYLPIPASNEVTVTVGAVISASTTKLCPGTTSAVLSLSPGSGTMIQWEKMACGESVWTSIPNATATTYTVTSSDSYGIDFHARMICNGTTIFSNILTIYQLSTCNSVPEACPVLSDRHKREEEAQILSEAVIYPNPSNGFMQLNYNMEKNQFGELQIMDMLGRQVSSYKLSAEENTLYIHEPNLKDGIYFYRMLINGELVKTDKFSIVH
jgi:hypothetical protein